MDGSTGKAAKEVVHGTLPKPGYPCVYFNVFFRRDLRFFLDKRFETKQLFSLHENQSFQCANIVYIEIITVLNSAKKKECLR